MRFLLAIAVISLQSCVSISALNDGCTVYVEQNLHETKANHFSNFPDALRSVETGATVCFKQGIYETINIQNIDGGNDKITITAIPGDIVTIKGKNFRGSGVKISKSKNIIIRNMAITGGLYGIYVKSSSNIELIENRISNVGQEGIIIKAGPFSKTYREFTIKNNKISDTGITNGQYGEGIYIGDGKGEQNGTISNVRIFQNTIDNASNEAIDIKVNSTNIEIVENILINTNLLFNGAITIGTANRKGVDSHIIVSKNLIYNVSNRSGYRPIGIAIGHGNVEVSENYIVDQSGNFVGICLYTTFANESANRVVVKGNNVLTQGSNLVKNCGDGGTGVNKTANLHVLD